MAYSYTFTGKSSAVSLTSNFFLQNFYKNNRNAMKVSTRSNYNQTELSYEDSRALKKAVSKLSSFSFTEEENGENLISTVQAFAETYNNTIDSTSSEDSDTYRQNKQLKALTKKFGDKLEDIGITIEEDGKLTVNETILGKSTMKEVKEVFSDDSGYMKSMKSIAKRMHSISYDEVYTLMTGNGGRINISL